VTIIAQGSNFGRMTVNDINLSTHLWEANPFEVKTSGTSLILYRYSLPMRALHGSRVSELATQPDDLRGRWRPADCSPGGLPSARRRRLASERSAGLKTYDDRGAS
jgi:hypothetical protein